MQNGLLPRAEKYIKKQHRFKTWHKVVGILACMVVFCTTYALILPAITIEKTTYCGIEAHTHGPECYEKRLICGYGEGTETSASSEESHIHTDGCYRKWQELNCKYEPHIHDESCIQTEKNLICTQEHEHTDECFQITETYVCNQGEEKHIHSSECYETKRELRCNYRVDEEVETTSEEPHEHTDDCYELVLICEIPEHEHTLPCFSNPEADIEEQEVWERTVSGVKLTGQWAEDLVAVAESQIGYEESAANYMVSEDEETIKGYTRYGAWFGEPYGDWSAMFVSFCLNYANISERVVPRDMSCENWVKALSTSAWDLYRDTKDYVPQKGDIVFFDSDGDDSADRVSIVTEVDTENEKIETIEGDSANKVQRVKYSAKDSKICGYCTLPKQEDLNIPTVTKSAVFYTDGNYANPLENEAKITLTGPIPEEAVVRAFPVTVDTYQEVLCAYDISIFMPDGSVYEPLEGDTISVTIQPAGMSGEEIKPNTTAYYIPENDEPVPIKTSVQEDGTVNFETDHFSVYALMRSGTMTEVYINGATGSDTGTGTQSDPVRTLEQALSLVGENGTIYVSGTITVNTAENWSIDINGVKMQRASGFTGPLVTVANGGSLTLSNLTMNGGSGTPPPVIINNNTTYSTTYATNSAKAPLIVVNTGGDLTVTDGTVLEYNSNKPDTGANGAYTPNGYVGLGGAVYCSGNMTMTGGLIQYCEAQSGGGVYIETQSSEENASFRLSGGTIDHNYARNVLGYAATKSIYRTNAGGGVYVGNNSEMLMSGGTVSNNQSSREGGGISLGWLDRTHGNAIYNYTTEFNMTGGTITGNEALSTGGGLNIAAGRNARVSAGYITNNKAYGYESQGGFRVYSGGGIYIDASQWDASGNYAGVPGKLTIHRVVITENSTDYQGGGFASCPTGQSYVNFNYSKGDGTAIYNNTANTGLVGNNTQIGISQMSSKDFISGSLLGGGDYNWTSSVNGNFTNFGNTLTDTSPEIVTARSMATTWVTDNHGYLGGGIGCNGVLDAGGGFGDNTESITITKVWEDGLNHPEYISFQVLQDGQPYGEPIKIYKTLENGQEVWPTYYIDDLPEGHIYTVEEIPVPGYESEVTQIGRNFTITNTQIGFWVMKKWEDSTAEFRPASIDVQLLQNGIPYGTPQQLTAANGWVHFWTNLPESNANGVPYIYTVQEESVPDGYYCSSSEFVTANNRWEITNTMIETTSVSTEKRWASGTPPASSVTIQLKADGQNLGDPVVLDSANNWFYKWENLLKYTAENAPDGTPIVYTVKEVNNTGYWSTIEVGDPASVAPAWVEKTTLEDGKTYMLVNANRALTASGTYGLAWTDVTANLSNATNPSGAALWTYGSTGSTLQNADGKYLVPGYYTSGSTNVYIFSTYTSSRNRPVAITNGRLTSSYFNPARYFTGSFDQYNYGSTTTNTSQAADIKIYTLEGGSTAGWGDTHYIVTNETAPDSMDVNFRKFSVISDAEDPTLLAGATLALYLQENSATTIPGTSVTGTLINQWTSADAPNSVHIENLEQGTYYLIETVTPTGYLGLSGPLIFTVDPQNSQVLIVEYPGNEELEGTNLFDNGEADLPVNNQIAFTLPETGGAGTLRYAIGGVLLILTALFLLYIQRKRRKEVTISF